MALYIKGVVRALDPILARAARPCLAWGGVQSRLQHDLYPGTAVVRMLAARQRVLSLTADELNGRWKEVRRKLLWAGGLRDLPYALPGRGYTGHCFNDSNHVALTCMLDSELDNFGERGIGRWLGHGILVASVPDMGPGASWACNAVGCDRVPPQDVAHLHFRSHVAFQLIWCPTPEYDTFLLVDDDGVELARGTPCGGIPSFWQRRRNYGIMAGSKYAEAADELSAASGGSFYPDAEYPVVFNPFNKE